MRRPPSRQLVARALLLLAACLAQVGAGEAARAAAKAQAVAPVAAPAPFPLDLVLSSPLTSVVHAVAVPPGDKVLNATIVVPPDAPADLGIGAFVGDRDGGWFQQVRPGTLAPGRHHLRFAMTSADLLASEPLPLAWNALWAQDARRAGLILYSASASRATVRVERLVAEPATAAAGPDGEAALRDLHLDGYADGLAHGRTGERWTLALRPDPLPANPYDAAQFTLDLVVTTPAGATLRVPCFHRQPMRSRDRGDREELQAEGAGRFEARFRPRQPGTHRLRLEAIWRTGGGSRSRAVDLPDLLVAGQEWDGYVRVDPTDRRFFVRDGAWCWPIGVNFHSPYDLRSQQRLGTKLTPDRGTLVYRDLFRRLSAAGGDFTEIWMSAWNLALEWREDWPGFRGIGRYNQANAWKLDAILDEAEACGVRINLVVNNHGQTAPSADREWKNNPYNAVHGGPAKRPEDWFTEPAALAGQENLRRYLIGRYADHPAIFGWKLYSEIDLTALKGEAARVWHEQAAARWHALDIYAHPVGSHWAGDYRRPQPEVCALPGLDYLCIDAYRRERDRSLTSLLWDSTQAADRGMHRYNKPIVTTEYGASSQAGPKTMLAADLATAGWAALVAGHGTGPMTWWWEWIDQEDRWQSFGALRRFIAGEDARSPGARAARLAVASPTGSVWSGAWVRRGRILGYLMDERYGLRGDRDARHEAALLTIGETAAGPLRVEWWDADDGRQLSLTEREHAGGSLELPVPAFTGHLAFKLVRTGPAETAAVTESAPDETDAEADTGAPAGN